MIENVTKIKSHNPEKHLTEWTASRVELNIILAKVKYGVEEIRMKILKYFNVLSRRETESLAIKKCSRF